MTEREIISEYIEIYRSNIKHEMAINMRSIGGKVSGLKRKAYQDERLTILKQMVDDFNIYPTLHLLEQIDLETFDKKSNFQKYSELFKIKKGRTMKILKMEKEKIGRVQKYQNNYFEKKQKVDFLFMELKALSTAVFDFQEGKEVDTAHVKKMLDHFPEMFFKQRREA